MKKPRFNKEEFLEVYSVGEDIFPYSWIDGITYIPADGFLVTYTKRYNRRKISNWYFGVYRRREYAGMEKIFLE